MEDLRAHGGELLPLHVIEPPEEPGRWDLVRVRREHARHVRPCLEPLRAEHRREVGGGGVRAAAAQQDGLAALVRRNEALRDHDLRIQAVEPALKVRVGIEGARGGEIPPLLGKMPVLLDVEYISNVHPLDGESSRGQERRAQLRRHQLAHPHHTGLQARTALANERRAQCHPAELLEIVAEHGLAVETQLHRQIELPLTDLLQLRLVLAADGLLHQLLEGIRDAAQRRADDHGTKALLQPLLRNVRDRFPARAARHARAAEFQHDPVGRGLTLAGRWVLVTCFWILEGGLQWRSL